MRRVLRPGGRVAVGTWLSIDIPFVKDLDHVSRQRLGIFTDIRHSFGDGRALAAVLAGNGLQDVRVETVSHDVRMTDGPVFARMNAMAVVGMSPHCKCQRGRDEPLHEGWRVDVFTRN
jgi:hypothetical protein